MLAPIPYIDLDGYKQRSKVAPQDVDYVAGAYPGYVEHRIARASSYVNARVHKRVGTPLGLSAPPLVGIGTAPPLALLTGRPTVGSLEIVIQVTTAGDLGTGQFQWSANGGRSWTQTSQTLAATFVLAGTGLTVTFPPGPYASDNDYRAPTPIDEIVLGWIVAMVDVDVWQRRGANPQDPTIVDAKAERDAALEELREAADGQNGLFELPTNDQAGDSAVTRTTPQFYTENSPYVSADRQERAGLCEDAALGNLDILPGDPIWPR